MHWLRNWFRKRRTDRHPPARPPSRVRLQLEPLEDRQVPSVTSHNALVIPHVAVNTIYYGAGWNQNPGTAQQTAQLDAYFSDLTNSPYMDMLGEYGVGRGGLERHATFLDGPASGTVTDQDLRAVLASKLAAGQLNAPAANRVFMIFTGPNVLVQRGNGSSAPNTSFFYGYHDAFNLPTGGTFYYAVMPYPGGVNAVNGSLTAFQQMTGAASHELAEAVTDPDLHSGWFDSSGNEIGDLVNLHYGALHGYTVQYEWSNNAQAGMLWNENGHWVALGQGQVTQLVTAPNTSGGQDVFGIGINNDVYFRATGPAGGPYGGGAWTDLGGPAGAIAVGRDADGSRALFAINKYTGSVSVYSTRTGAWTGLGGYARALAVGTNSDGRLELFVVGGNYQVYHLYETAPDGAFNSGWASLGGAAQSVAVGREQNGRLDVFAVWSDNTVRYIRQAAPAAWGQAWINLGGWAFAGSVALGTNSDGRLEVFAIGSNNQVYHQAEKAPNGSFSGSWASLGGWASQIAVGLRADGRLCVIGIGRDGAVYEIPQVAGSPNWNGGWVDEGEWAQALLADLSGREVLIIGTGNGPNLLPLS